MNEEPINSLSKGEDGIEPRHMKQPTTFAPDHLSEFAFRQKLYEEEQRKMQEPDNSFLDAIKSGRVSLGG